MNSPCTALGTISRVGGGCLLIETTYKHPGLGSEEVLLDVFGKSFQVCQPTKVMFLDTVNVVVAVPPEIEFMETPCQYMLNKAPADGVVMVEEDEVPVQVVGLCASGFVFECTQYLETRLPAKYMVRGALRDHIVEGDYSFERSGPDRLTCGVAIKANDRIQAALWLGAVRDLVA
ncbi:MAG: hypothetical protein KF857_12410 [Fimbriimonadaceae bacterium]|nr:hypothetical protein [Fimbriimonadaceae bacterium]